LNVRYAPISSLRRAPSASRARLLLGNLSGGFATPKLMKVWPPPALKEKLIKIGAKVISRGRYVAFQMAEVAIPRGLFADPRGLFADILRMIAELRPPPLASTA